MHKEQKRAVIHFKFLEGKKPKQIHADKWKHWLIMPLQLILFIIGARSSSGVRRMSKMISTVEDQNQYTLPISMTNSVPEE